jgi:hypothetical protein
MTKYCAKCGSSIGGFVYKQEKLSYDEACFLKLEKIEPHVIEFKNRSRHLNKGARLRLQQEIEDAEAMISMLNDVPLLLVK